MLVKLFLYSSYKTQTGNSLKNVTFSSNDTFFFNFSFFPRGRIPGLISLYFNVFSSSMGTYRIPLVSNLLMWSQQKITLMFLRYCVQNRDPTKLRRRRQYQKSNRFSGKTTTLHVHHAFFLYISLPSLHDYDVKCLNFKFCWGRERQGDKFYHLCLTRCGPFSSAPT